VTLIKKKMQLSQSSQVRGMLQDPISEKKHPFIDEKN
jgi:hypothetical protein